MQDHLERTLGLDLLKSFFPIGKGQAVGDDLLGRDLAGRD